MSATCDVPRDEALDPKVSPLESTVAASLGVRFGDLSEAFCDAAVCPSMRSGILVYRDANHMTAEFAGRQAAALQLLLAPEPTSHELSSTSGSQ